MTKKSIIRTAIVIAVIALLALGVIVVRRVAFGTGESASDARYTVVTTFFPLFEMTEAIVAGEDVEVVSLIPPGSDPHHFDPSAGDLRLLEEARLFVTLGLEFAQLEERLIDAVGGDIAVAETTIGIPLLSLADTEEAHADEGDHAHEESDDDHDEGDEDHDDEDDHHHDESEERHHDEGEEDHHGEEDNDHHHDENDDREHSADEGDHAAEGGAHSHSHGDFDVHVWLSPTHARTMVGTIVDALVAVDPDREARYEANGAEYLAQLSALEGDFRGALQNCAQELVIVTHDAYRYLADEHGFRTASIYQIEEASEPTAAEIAALIELAREAELSYILYEAGGDQRLARLIADEINGETRPVSAIESPFDELGYLELMELNLETIALALECG